MTQAGSIVDLSPNLAAAYSPNLHQWLRRRATGRKGGVVLDRVCSIVRTDEARSHALVAIGARMGCRSTAPGSQR